MTNIWATRRSAPSPESILAPSPAVSPEVVVAVRAAIAENAAGDSVIEQKQTPETVSPDSAKGKLLNGAGGLSQLVDEDFPFDESQLAAVEGMVNAQYSCLTGAAGTGKTTTTKKLVDTLIKEVGVDLVNMAEYFKKGSSAADADDDYEIQENFIPAICMISFTGRATQMTKKNFPRDWHGNIMTIHRCLGFVPEYYEDMNDDGDLVNKMRFVPTYTADLKLPWDIIIIDEAGMTGLDLWHQLWAAMKPGARIYMIGDINQLPPVHGRSIFGFAMSKWPSFELTHIHRQKGAHNAIVENAWRVLNGQMPVSGGNFQMMELKGDAQKASRIIRGVMPKLMEAGVYEPNRDTIITAINGNEGSRGYALGQLPLNREFALIFNPKSTHPRYIIDSGRDRKMFAVGDKVMATKNDYQAGITNGMTGIIIEIERNAQYGGDSRRFGMVDEVNEWMADEGIQDEGEEFTLEELAEDFEAKDAGEKKKEERQGRGPASHSVTVRFGDDQHGFDMIFASLSEVDSLMTAYVVTCHKMQGGESPTIVIICHDAHKQMLYREWLYTAITRASGRCYLLYTPTALRTAISKQRIAGKTLKEKIRAFELLSQDNGMGVSVKVNMPEATGTERGQEIGKQRATTDGEMEESTAVTVIQPTGLAALAAKAKEVAAIHEAAAPMEYVEQVQERVVEKIIGHPLHVHIHMTMTEPVPEPIREQRVDIVEVHDVLPAPVEIPAVGWSYEPERIKSIMTQKQIGYHPLLMLTYQPQPEPEPEPVKKVNPWAARLAKKN